VAQAAEMWTQLASRLQAQGPLEQPSLLTGGDLREYQIQVRVASNQLGAS
jgi:hypothetical protein